MSLDDLNDEEIETITEYCTFVVRGVVEEVEVDIFENELTSGDLIESYFDNSSKSLKCNFPHRRGIDEFEMFGRETDEEFSKRVIPKLRELM